MTGLRWCSNESNCWMDIRYVLKNLWGYLRRSEYVLKYSPFVWTSSLNGCFQYSLWTEFSVSNKHTAKTHLWYLKNWGCTTFFANWWHYFDFWQRADDILKRKKTRKQQLNPEKPATTSSDTAKKMGLIPIWFIAAHDNALALTLAHTWSKWYWYKSIEPIQAGP